MEDLAYAYYVQEYTSGRFGIAMECANRALVMLEYLREQSSMQAASASRVKGRFMRKKKETGSA